MIREDFIQSSTMVRVAETKLLSKQQFSNLIETKSFEEAISSLRDTPYGEELEKLEKKEDYDIALNAHLQRIYKEVKAMTNAELVVEFATKKYVAHNLKVLVKEHILKTDFSPILSSLWETENSKIRDLLREGRFSEETPEEKAVSQVIINYEEYKDPQLIDILLDKFRLESSMITAEKLSVPLFEEIAATEIDISNVKTVLRSKKQNKQLGFVREALAKGGKVPIESLLSVYNESLEALIEKLMHTDFSGELKSGLEEFKDKGTLQGVEKALDNVRMNVIKKAKSITYGAEILYAFLQAKETEIKNIRIVLVSKLNGISSEEIRERLRDIYG